MSFLQRLPFLKPRVRPVGDTLEAGDAAQELSRRRRALVFKGFLFVAIVVAAMLAFPRGTVYQYTVEQDEIWRQPNLHAPFTFAIQKPADELERERDDVRSRTSPIFQENAEAVAELRMAAEELGDRFDRVLGKYASYVENRT